MKNNLNSKHKQTPYEKPRKGLLLLNSKWIYILLIIIGVLGLSYLFLSNFISQLSINKTISSMTASYNDPQNTQKLKQLHQAQLYNGNLAGKKTNNNVWPYDQQLSYTGAQIMGWVEIPKIDVKICLYHGTSDEVLMAGAGHLK